MVNYYNQTPYLPVGIIQVDRVGCRVLIELPTEADSGVNRMWIPFETFLLNKRRSRWHELSECRTLMIVPGLDAKEPIHEARYRCRRGNTETRWEFGLGYEALARSRVGSRGNVLPSRAPDLARRGEPSLPSSTRSAPPRKPGAIAAVRSRRWKRMRPNGERRRKSSKMLANHLEPDDVRSSIRRDGGMIVYLDSVIVIDLIEGPDPFRVRAEARLAQITAANDQVATSHLTRLECRVKPIRLNDASLLADYEAFFNKPDLRKFPSRTGLRASHGHPAQYNLKLGDSLRLAAAVEHGCGLFLTNDVQRRRFPDIPVEELT